MIVFTTAPVEYDYCTVETLETFECDIFEEGRSKTWRKVRLTGDAAQNEGQRLRYSSGLHGSWEKDPRDEEREFKARRAAWRADQEVRALGKQWLAEASVEAIEAAINEGALPLGVERADARSRVRAIEAANVAAENDATFETLKAQLPTTIRAYSEHGHEKAIYHNVLVDYRVPGSDPAKARVIYNNGNGEGLGELENVLFQLREGRYEAVNPETVPPKVVLDKINQPSREILCIELDGQTLYVGAVRFSGIIVVLDSEGRKVRSKTVAKEATRLFWEWIENGRAQSN